MMSPTRMLRISSKLTLAVPSDATTSTSAIWICCVIRRIQRLSTSSASPCRLDVSESRIGSIIEYGMQKWIWPDTEPSSTVKVDDTTTSLGVAMLANCVFISERMYSNSTGNTGSHDLV